MKLPKEQQLGILKALMAHTSQIAKFNLTTFGYLEHVLVAITNTGPIISNLQWKDSIEKKRVIKNCVNQIAHIGCIMYVFVGEANVKRFKLDRLSSMTIQALKQPNHEPKSCIVIYGATKVGEKLAVITPILKKNPENEIRFERSIWINKQEVFTSWIDSKMFDGIFKKY